MSEGDDARRGLFGNMTSGGEGDESARSGLRVRGCRHSTTGRPAQLPSRRFPPRISFPPLSSSSSSSFRETRARSLSLSVFPTLASSLLLRPLPLLPPESSRVESSRAAVTVSRWISPHPTPSPLSPRSDRRISRQDFRFSTRHLLLTLFPPPFLEEEEKIGLNDSFLPSFPPFSIESKI